MVQYRRSDDCVSEPLPVYSYVDFDGTEAMRAADALPKEEALDEAFLRLYCSRVTDGVDRLHRWLSSIELRTSFQIEDVVTIRKRA